MIYVRPGEQPIILTALGARFHSRLSLVIDLHIAATLVESGRGRLDREESHAPHGVGAETGRPPRFHFQIVEGCP